MTSFELSLVTQFYYSVGSMSTFSFCAKYYTLSFFSDLITPLPQKIDNGETEIHVFYAKKMGEKYLARYKKYFKNPVIHERDLRHEELLGVYTAEWCTLVREVCL